MTILPALALFYMIAPIGNGIGLILLTGLASTVYFTSAWDIVGPQYHIDQVSVRLSHYDALIDVKKEEALLTFYCYAPAPADMFNDHTHCWRLISTRFDIYLLHADKDPALTKVTTISYGTHVTNRDYGSLSTHNGYRLIIKGWGHWGHDGNVYLSEEYRPETGASSKAKTYVVNTDTGRLDEIAAVPSELDRRYSPYVPRTCLEKGRPADTWRDKMAISGFTGMCDSLGNGVHNLSYCKPSIDIVTEHHGIVTQRKDVYLLDSEGNLVLNPSYQSVEGGDPYCTNAR